MSEGRVKSNIHVYLPKTSSPDLVAKPKAKVPPNAQKTTGLLAKLNFFKKTPVSEKEAHLKTQMEGCLKQIHSSEGKIRSLQLNIKHAKPMELPRLQKALEIEVASLEGMKKEISEIDAQLTPKIKQKFHEKLKKPQAKLAARIQNALGEITKKDPLISIKQNLEQLKHSGVKKWMPEAQIRENVGSQLAKLNKMAKPDEAQALRSELTDLSDRFKKDYNYRDEKIGANIKHLQKLFPKDFFAYETLAMMRDALKNPERNNEFESLLASFGDKKHITPSGSEIKTLRNIIEAFAKGNPSLEKQSKPDLDHLRDQIVEANLTELQQKDPEISKLIDVDALRLAMKNSDNASNILMDTLPSFGDKTALQKLDTLLSIINEAAVSDKSPQNRNTYKAATDKLYQQHFDVISKGFQTALKEIKTFELYGTTDESFHSDLQELAKHESSLKELLDSSSSSTSPYKHEIAKKAKELNTHIQNIRSKIFKASLATASPQVKQIFKNLQEVVGENFLLTDKLKLPFLIALKQPEYADKFAKILDQAKDFKAKRRLELEDRTSTEDLTIKMLILSKISIPFNQDLMKLDLDLTQYSLTFLPELISHKIGQPTNTQYVTDTMSLALQKPEDVKGKVSRYINSLYAQKNNLLMGPKEQALAEQDFIFRTDLNCWVKSSWNQDKDGNLHWTGSLAVTDKKPVERHATINFKTLGYTTKEDQILALDVIDLFATSAKFPTEALDKKDPLLLPKEFLKLAFPQIDGKTWDALKKKKENDPMTPEMQTASDALKGHRKELLFKFQRLSNAAIKFTKEMETSTMSAFLELGQGLGDLLP